MPPPIESASLDLHLESRAFYLYQFSTNHAQIPRKILDRIITPDGNGFVSVTRTNEEVSIVLDDELENNEEMAVSKWKCIRVQGPMELSAYFFKSG